MKLCGTCRHWAQDAQQAGRPERGNCQRIRHVYDGDPSELVLVNEFEGIGEAWLETRAEFGCILHEAPAFRDGRVPAPVVPS